MTRTLSSLGTSRADIDVFARPSHEPRPSSRPPTAARIHARRSRMLFTPGVGRAVRTCGSSTRTPSALRPEGPATRSSRSSLIPRAPSQRRPTGRPFTPPPSSPAIRPRRSPEAAVAQICIRTGMPGPATITLDGQTTTSTEHGADRQMQAKVVQMEEIHWLDLWHCLRPVRHDHAAGSGRLRDRRYEESARTARREHLRPRRYHALQHGSQPEEREGLRLEHRRPQRRTIRRSHAWLHLRRRQYRR